MHRTRLQDHDSTVGAERPLHILRRLEVCLEFQGDPGDLDGLPIRERRPAGTILRDLLSGNALPRAEDKAVRRWRSAGLITVMLARVDDEKVGLEPAVDNRLGQTDGGADSEIPVCQLASRGSEL